MQLYLDHETAVAEMPAAIPRYLKDEWIEWLLAYPEGGSEKEHTQWVLANPMYTHKLLREPKGMRRSLEESRQMKSSTDSAPSRPEPKGMSTKEESRQPKSSADSAPSCPEPRGMSSKEESRQPKTSADSAPSHPEPLLTWEMWEMMAHQRDAQRKVRPLGGRIPQKERPRRRRMPQKERPLG